MASGAVNAAVSAGLVGTGAGLLQGKSLADSVKTGLIAGAIGGGMAALPSMTSDSADVKDSSPYNPQGKEGLAETGIVKAQADPNSLVTPPAQNAPVGNTPAPVDAGAPIDASLQAPTASGSVAPPAQLNAPRPAQIGVAPPAPMDVAPPTFMDSVKGAANGAMDKATGLYDEYIKPYTPSGVKEAGMGKAETAGSDAYERAIKAGRPESYAQTVASKAYDAAMPGAFSTYGPTAAAGLAGLALTGGFDVKQPELTPEQKAMQDDVAAQRARIAADPGQYHIQNLKGVTYDSRGVPISSTPYDPSIGQGTSLVPAIPRLKPLSAGYKTPSSLKEEDNAASRYPDLTKYLYKPPKKAAMGGGIGSLGTGGYPRKNGAIDGPGTATSDSIPAMLSDGEFVMTAKAVRGAGKGSRLAGAKKMYALMHQLERNASRS